MLGQTRDLAAVFFLEKQLSKLREDIIYNTIEGQPFTPEEATHYENEIKTGLKQNYYKMDVERLLHQNPPDTMDEAFAQRTQKASEEILWQTHFMLKKIPFVGQAGFEDN